MLNKIESLNNSRRKMLLGMIIGFGIWQGSYILNSIIPEIKKSPILIISIVIIGLIGWALFFFQLIRMMKLISEIKKDPKLYKALNDEFYRHIRLKAFRAGFFIVLISQILLFLINKQLSLSAESAIQINIFLCAISPTVAFLIYDREKLDE